MRGTVGVFRNMRYIVRITPACAGNSESRIFCCCPLEDHPRLCGEQEQPLQMENILTGSPPLVRGTDSTRIRKPAAVRITPACAGNRWPGYWIPQLEEDHPRLCGEQAEGPFDGGCDKGSPPLVRGTGYRSQERFDRRRITPACAGNRRIYRRRICKR